MAEERTPRSAEDRTAEMRPSDNWVPPSNLPDPTPRPGWVHRWVRASSFNTVDNRNLSKKFREGWEPCNASEYRELKMVCDRNSAFPDKIEVGGLLLCRMPVEKAEQRKAYFQKKADDQLRAVDNNYLRDSHPSMPKLEPERETRTTIGRD